MDTILQLTRRLAHNASPSSVDIIKYSPTETLKMNNNRDNKRIERRKPNWTECENIFLLDQFAMHREILTCKATDASTNLRKQEIWRLICQNLNQNNTLVRRTPAEVRRKWKNLVTAAKKEVWEMRHQIHISGGGGSNGRKISELSQRVLQLHSSGNSNANSNGIFGSLAAGLSGATLLGGAGHGDKYNNNHSSKYSEYLDDKSFIPAHFTPIVTLSESNNNHIDLLGSANSDGPPSPMSEEDDDESSESRNAGEFMSDSGIYEQEGIDLRVNVARANGGSGRLNHLDDMDDDDDDIDDAKYAALANKLHQARNLMNNGPIILDNKPSLASVNNRNNSPIPQNLRNVTGAAIISAVLAGKPFPNHNVIDNGNNNHSPIGRKQGGCSDLPNSDETMSSTSPVSGSIVGMEVGGLKIVSKASPREAQDLSCLYKEKLRLQIDILKLRKRKLIKELNTNVSQRKALVVPRKSFLWSHANHRFINKNRATMQSIQPSSPTEKHEEEEDEDDAHENCPSLPPSSSPPPTNDIDTKQSS